MFDRCGQPKRSGDALLAASVLVAFLKVHRMASSVTEVAVPRDGLLAGALPRVEYADAYRGPLPAGRRFTPTTAARLVFGSAPRWITTLLRLRNRLVRLVGLKTTRSHIVLCRATHARQLLRVASGRCGLAGKPSGWPLCTPVTRRCDGPCSSAFCRHGVRHFTRARCACGRAWRVAARHAAARRRPPLRRPGAAMRSMPRLRRCSSGSFAPARVGASAR